MAVRLYGILQNPAPSATTPALHLAQAETPLSVYPELLQGSEGNTSALGYIPADFV